MSSKRPHRAVKFSNGLHAALCVWVAFVLVAGLTPIGVVSAQPNEGTRADAQAAQQARAQVQEAKEAQQAQAGPADGSHGDAVPSDGDLAGREASSDGNATLGGDIPASPDPSDSSSDDAGSEPTQADIEGIPAEDDALDPAAADNRKSILKEVYGVQEADEPSGFEELVAQGADYLDQPLHYLELDDVLYTHEDTLKITSASTAWGTAGKATWYGAIEDTEISSHVTVAGDVVLILADGVTLSATDGVELLANASLTVYGQSDTRATVGELNVKLTSSAYRDQAGIRVFSSSSLTVNGGSVHAESMQDAVVSGGPGGPGIGEGANPLSNGPIVVNRGWVYAKAYKSYGAGIGTGSGGNQYAGPVTINGGTVEAYGGYYGAGLGGGGGAGAPPRGAKVTITGGTVTARGCTGIGGGFGNRGGDNQATLITGGNVDAKGSMGAGIGGGGGNMMDGRTGGSAGSITITGGTVKAQGARRSAGIGSATAVPTKNEGPTDGSPGNGGTITISGGSVEATSSDGPGIGMGLGWTTSGTLNISGGTVKATSSSNVGIAIKDITVSGGTVGTEDADDGEGGTISGVPVKGVRSQTLTLTWTDETFAGSSITATSYVTTMVHEKPWVVRGTGVLATVDNAAGTTIVPSADSLLDSVPYLAYVDGQMLESSCSAYSVVADSTTELTDGWWVLGANTTVSERMTCVGDVHLILEDGFTLNAQAGICVPDGASLAVYGQQECTGVLNATGGANAAIGGDSAAGASGKVAIHGGRVSAVSSSGGGAGIGGANKSEGGEVLVHGGVVTATGSNGGAGIGGGGGNAGNCPGGSVTITGGTVAATGKANGAGIGGGWASAGGTVTISGGTVMAEGETHAAGIGGGGRSGGACGDGATVIITGGSVEASCTGGLGAGIGGGGTTSGAGGNGGSVSITGGTITASSAAGAGIGGGNGETSGNLQLDWADTLSQSSDKPRITSSSYAVAAVAYGDASRPFALTDSPAVALSESEIAAFTVQTTIAPLLASVPYLDAKQQTQYCSTYTNLSEYLATAAPFGEITAYADSATPLPANVNRDGTFVGLPSGWYVVDEDITYNSSRLVVQGSVHLILKNGTTFRDVWGMNLAAGNSLAIYQQPVTEGASVGSLILGGSTRYHAAGLGGYNGTSFKAFVAGATLGSASAGSLTVNGGRITVTGGMHGAGIGGAANSGSGGTVVINYGTVRANGGVNGGNGIGGGIWGASGNITINDGAVTAVGGSPGTYVAAGIGGGSGVITINGGTVKAQAAGASAAAIGGRGGTHSGKDDTININGGVIDAYSGRGIGAGGSNTQSNINFNWTTDTFATTEVLASDYYGTVKFLRPYVQKQDGGQLAYWNDEDDNNIDGVTIIPGDALVAEAKVKEGRWYADFTDGANAVSLPVNSAWTARLDLSSPVAVAADYGYVARGMRVSFGEALPAGTVLTLSVLDKKGAYSQYYAVLHEGSDTVELTSFMSMKDRGVRFAPSFDTDRVYLLSADFAGAAGGRGSVTSEPVSITTNIRFSNAAGSGQPERMSYASVARHYSLVALGAITAGADTVAVTASPAGSLLLAGQRVYLVGEVAPTNAGEGLNLQATTATYGTGGSAVAGTWIAENVVAFDLGEYGSDVTRAATPFAFAGDTLASGTYPVRWALYADDSMTSLRETWNVRDTLVSNEASSAYAPGAELPRLTAEAQTDLDRLYDGGETLEFAVTSNRPYKVAVEKQTALHTFAQQSVTAERPAAVPPAALATETVAIPTAPGTYRIVFTMTDATANDNVYYTVVVQ